MEKFESQDLEFLMTFHYGADMSKLYWQYENKDTKFSRSYCRRITLTIRHDFKSFEVVGAVILTVLSIRNRYQDKKMNYSKLHLLTILTVSPTEIGSAKKLF